MTNIRYAPLGEKKLKEVAISLTGVEMAFVWDKDNPYAFLSAATSSTIAIFFFL